MQILFAVNPEHEEENRYLTLSDEYQECDDPSQCKICSHSVTIMSSALCIPVGRTTALDYTHDEIKDWKFVTVHVKGPFIGELRTLHWTITFCSAVTYRLPM